jgi:hypothetical protein
MIDDNTPSAERPHFDALVAELRRTRLEKSRRDGAVNAELVMQKAMDLLRAGKLTAADIAHLNAIRIRADEQLP